MGLSVGIVGLPNVGKSTLFKALTRKDILIANYPFATIDPSVGVVPVPDDRLYKLAEFSKTALMSTSCCSFGTSLSCFSIIFRIKNSLNIWEEYTRDRFLCKRIVDNGYPREYASLQIKHGEGLMLMYIVIGYVVWAKAGLVGYSMAVNQVCWERSLLLRILCIPNHKEGWSDHFCTWKGKCIWTATILCGGIVAFIFSFIPWPLLARRTDDGVTT